MKTKITTPGRIVGFAIAVALFAVATTTGNAQEKGLKLRPLGAWQRVEGNAFSALRYREK